MAPHPPLAKLQEPPPFAELCALASRTIIEPAALARSLDRLGFDERRAAVMACGGTRRQAALWRALAGAPRVRLDDLMPREIPPMRPVIFSLKNSLAAFSESQKRFVRAPDGQELYGYNHHTFGWFTGPGHFTARSSSNVLGGVELDYTTLPPAKADGWPAIHSNERLFSRFVYGGMFDYMRRISHHAFIGAAVRRGQFANMFFIITREV